MDKITLQYNQTMQQLLPKYGIRFEVIPRKEAGGEVISASRVRKLLGENAFDQIARLVPETTLEYLKGMTKDDSLTPLHSANSNL